MLELNKVLLVGNLTRDPEMRYLPSGKGVADLGLAVNRRWFDRNAGERREETLFIDVTVWDKTAEFCSKYLQKGSAIFVEGRLKMDTWEDRQGGGRRSKVSVVAERVQFADSKPQGGGESQPSGGGYRDAAPAAGAPSAGAAPPQSQSSPPPAAAAPPMGPQGGNTEDDLPF